MGKHTQTIRRQIADELFECVWPFVKLALKGLSGKSVVVIKGYYKQRGVWNLNFWVTHQ